LFTSKYFEEASKSGKMYKPIFPYNLVMLLLGFEKALSNKNNKCYLGRKTGLPGPKKFKRTNLAMSSFK